MSSEPNKVDQDCFVIRVTEHVSPTRKAANAVGTAELATYFTKAHVSETSIYVRAQSCTEVTTVSDIWVTGAKTFIDDTLRSARSAGYKFEEAPLEPEMRIPLFRVMLDAPPIS